MVSAATSQYVTLLEMYNKYFHKITFPCLPFSIAAAFQVFAWFGGTFLQQYTLIPRIIILWFFALGEYTFMSPTMNTAVEVLKVPESVLVVLYSAITLFVFIFINTFVFKNPFKLKYLVSYILLIAAIYIAYLY